MKSDAVTTRCHCNRHLSEGVDPGGTGLARIAGWKCPRESLGWVFLVISPLWLFPLAWTFAFSPSEIISAIGHVLIFAELLSLVALMVLFPTSIVLLFIRSQRRDAIRCLLLLLVLAAASYGGLRFRIDIWKDNIAAVGDRGRPLVEAIRAYEQKNGQPPRSLHELVPDHLGAIPTTGIGARPDFQYIVGQPDSYDDNPWVLSVTPPCVAGFDVFLYFPRQNYPDRGYGGALERIGDWAYVHE